jgi:ATP-dependent RNA helicase SUPV3L1/SUV3
MPVCSYLTTFRNIKRIVFETSFKFNNDGVYGRLSIAMVKQIAGRAGRYRTATQDVRDSQITPSTGRETISSTAEDIALPASLDELNSHVVKPVRGNHTLYSPGMTTLSVPENLGLVTTLHEADLPFIQDSMKADPPRLDTAGIHPPAEILKRFSAFFAPSTPFRFILRRLFNSATTNNRNFIASDREHLEIADVIEDIGPLSVVDRYIIAMCPVNPREDSGRNVVRAFAKCIARRSGGGFLDIPEINLEILDKPLSGDKDYLEELEMLHRAISLYCWLSFRFRAVFVNQSMAIHAKDLVEGQIERALNEFSANRKVRERLLFQSRRIKEEWLEAAKREEAMLERGRNLTVADADDLIENPEKETSEEESAREQAETSW